MLRTKKLLSMLKILIQVIVLNLLTASSAFACSLLDKRICEIGAKLQVATGGHTVQYVVDFSTRIMEYEWVIGKPDIIHLGETRDLEFDELYFGLAHEVGHSVLQHGRSYVESFAPVSDKTLSDLELFKKYGATALSSTRGEVLSHRHEYEADAFAAKILHGQSVDYAKAMKGFLTVEVGTSTHPRKRTRILRAKEAVVQSSQISPSLARTL